MRLLIAILGSCLVVASVAAAAERPADHPVNRTGEPWWSNPPPGTSSAPGPKVTEYPSTAGSGPKVTEIAPPVRVRQVAEFAPEPPSPRHTDNQPATFQQEGAAATDTPAAKLKATDASRVAAPQPPPPQQLPAAPATASSMTPATAAPAPVAPAAKPAAPAIAPTEPVPPLGLGSHADKIGLGKSPPTTALITVGGSLAVVLGLFFVIAWAMRKAAPRGSLLLPKEVFDILGRAPLGARQQVQLLRCGNKLLLVSITPGGTETLTEVTDPLEVDRIAGICHQAHPKSSTTAFRQVFQGLAPRSGEPSELGGEPLRRKRYRWEEKHA